MNNQIPIRRFHPNCKKYKKSAGAVRNKVMAKYADAVIVIWDGKSKGSRNMIEEAKKLKMPLEVYEG